MKGKTYTIAILYLLFSVSGSLFAIGEKTVTLDGRSISGMTDVRTGVTEIGQVRPGQVLALTTSRGFVPNAAVQQAPPDLHISFDERNSAGVGNPSLFRDSSGRYRVTVSPSLAVVDRRHARAGYGAALFPGASSIETVIGNSPGNGSSVKSGSVVPLEIEARGASALFAPNNRLADFTMEFWLHPLILENGEQVLLWVASLPPSPNGAAHSGANYGFQRILCTASRNRMQWSFLNFFASPDRTNYVDINLNGVTAVVPKTWSHHLIRFDSATGMVEYLVNGNSESIQYATSNRREGGEVYIPVAGQGGSFVLGGNYMGLMDEFKIHSSFVSGPALRKYPSAGGRIETRAIDLGEGTNDVIKIEASGGRTSVVQARINSEYKRNGRFLFTDDSEMQFFIRASDNPYRFANPWLPVTPGVELEGAVKGRYVQLAVDFYPSADGEASPFLEEIKITYFPEETPLPPPNLTAVAMDGAVRLTWRNSPSPDVQGYLVYYGTANDTSTSSVFFGEGAALGASPIDVGMTTTVRIDGLTNGTLYYFRVAAYAGRGNHNSAYLQALPYHVGEFSREVRARPLIGLR